jgi:hypothetical protein
MKHIVVTVMPSVIKKYAPVSLYSSHLNCLQNMLVPVQHIKKNPIHAFTPAQAAMKHAGALTGKNIVAMDASATMQTALLNGATNAFVTVVSNQQCINVHRKSKKRKREKEKK